MTTTSRQAEASANAMLGILLQGMMRGAAVRYENTQVIEGHPGLRPDIIITDSQRSPVVVEAEYTPARSVEREAVDRLALPVAGDTRVIEAAIALRYPSDIADASDLDGAIRSALLEYAVFYENETRFPASGWISGGVSDLADLIRLVSVSDRAVDAAAEALQQGIEVGASILNALADARPSIMRDVASLLGMSDVPQTRRMACAIIANAMVFHDRIAGMHDDVKTLRIVCGRNSDNPQAAIVDAWENILDINYFPIFSIAQDIVNQLPPKEAAQILRLLQDTAARVASSGASVAHDLTGRIFQRLIADRKYLATFYTLPASAALLARLAVAKLDSIDWADANAIGNLRVGDFACGTGALLSAVYEQIANRHQNAGGDPETLHPVMMEDVLYGCDVMPSAIHITGSTLAGMQPNVEFGNSRLYTLPYGRQPDRSVAIGSLGLLQASTMLTLFNTNDPAKRTGGMGEETSARISIDIPDDGFDIVIMNPPFTRATNHGGAHADVVNPAFAAFEASKSDMDAMGKRMRDLGRASCYDGKAGLASAFVALANRKLKPGGVLAFVLPLVATTGMSWKKFRELMAQHYTDISVLSIAAAGLNDISFSADTGLGECLVVARKLRKNEKAMGDMEFTSLTCRPDGFLQASEIAKSILNAGAVRGIEDGPYGGTRINAGLEQIGELIRTPSTRYERGEGWGMVRIRDFSIAQTADALTQSALWLPSGSDMSDLRMATLTDIGKRGLVHRLIVGPPHPAPFEKVPSDPNATYPALWNHNAQNEKKMVCVPDSQLLVRQGMEARAKEVWETASRAHLNLEFRFNSQPLAVAITDRVSIGGRAWPNVIFDDERFDYPFAIWCNSTLGLICSWWHSGRQDAGRGTMTISSAESLPTLDLRALNDAQLATAQEIFDEFRDLELQPAYLADADPNRALLDRRVVCDMLGFDDAVYEGVRMLAAKWCAEPSVHGGKRRPAGARLVV